MAYRQTIARVERALTETASTLDAYFDLPEDTRTFKPDANSWSINEILEHITLTSHFLMITLRNSRDKALKRAATQPIREDESNLEPMAHLSEPDAFAWIRPQHMEPTRTKTTAEVREIMRAQFQECLAILTELGRGEGSLHTVRMSVQALGKIDIYQWMYFLAQHARRHGMEIERILARIDP